MTAQLREFKCYFAFGGSGGGARGTKRAETHLFNRRARFRILGGFDKVERACRDFKLLTGVDEDQLDAETMTPKDLRRSAGEVAPDMIVITAPCKGATKLISNKKAAEPKYQRLNLLALRFVEVMVMTWAELPRLILFENVPGIVTDKRAKAMVAKVKTILRGAGYVLHDDFHDCGEIGGLAQHRKRWLLVARDPKRVPPLLYQPPKKRVRGIGEVIGELPLPGAESAGPMHELPKLSFLNWVRLALIPAGGDWRDLPGELPKGTKRRAKFRRHHVERWTHPSVTIGGSGSNGACAVADPRDWLFGHAHRVRRWDQPAGTVTRSPAPSSGAIAVADPRIDLLGLTFDPERRFRGFLGVRAWDQPAPAVTGRGSPSCGPFSVADPRLPLGCAPFKGAYGVRSWSMPAATVTGAGCVDNATQAIADPRIMPQSKNGQLHFGKYQVRGWDDAAKPIVGATRVGSGAQAVADPRIAVGGGAWGGGDLGVLGWVEPSGAVTGGSLPRNGSFSVADPRLAFDWNPNAHRNKLHVGAWIDAAGTVTGASHIGGGAPSVADPRLMPSTPPYDHAYAVLGLDEPSPTVAGGSDVGQGAYAFADKRAPKTPPYRLLTLDEAMAMLRTMSDAEVKRAPKDFIPVIIAEDGTWHRPLTTLELAMLQGCPATIDGKPLVLHGSGSTHWRESIGNMIPGPAMEAIAEQMLITLLGAETGVWSLSSGGSVWVVPEEAQAS